MEKKKKLKRTPKKTDTLLRTVKKISKKPDVKAKTVVEKKNPEPNILLLFEEIFERMPYAIAVTDDRGMIVKSNRFSKELFGIEPEKDKCIFDDPVLKKAGYGLLLEKARKGEYAEIPEFWFNMKNYFPDFPSHDICIKSIVFPIFNKKKIKNFILIIEDITDQKKAEGALIKSEEKYRQIFENIQAVYYEADMEGRILEISPSIDFFTKYKRDELLGTNVFDVYLHRSDRDALLYEISKKGRILDYPLMLKDKDGSTLHCSVNSKLIKNEKGVPQRIIGAIIDISPLHKTLEALKISEERYREIFNNANDIIWTSDLKGNFTSVNPVVEKLLGFKFESDAMPNIRNYITPESYRKSLEKIKKDLIYDGDHTTYEIDIISKTGKIVSLDVSSFLKYKNGKPNEIFGIARDITERKKAAEELNKTRAKYTELFETINDIVYTMDFDGNFTSVNPVAEKMLGYKFEEITEMNMRNYISPETAKMAFDNIAKKLKGEASNTVYEVEFVNKDGSYTSLEINSIISYKNGKPFEIFGIARDITSRKKQEEELNRTREKYKELSETTNDLVYTVNLEQKFSSMHPKCEQIIGYKAEEIVGMKVNDFISPESAKISDENLRKKLNGEAASTVYEVDFKKKDGSIISLEVNSMFRYKDGKPYEILGVAKDITERKKANEDLKKSEEKYKTIFENAPLGILTADTAGNIIEINPTLLQLLGSESVDETKSINLFSFQSLKDAGFADIFIKCIRTGIPEIYENTYMSKWGNKLDARVYAKPLKDPKENVIGIQVIVENITEEKEAERQIKSTLVEKEVLLREVHHRVKNNMQIIISLINMQMQDSKDEIMIKNFKELQQRVRTMSIIHEDLYMSGNLSKIDIGNYIKKLSGNLIHIYPHKFEIVLKYNIEDIRLSIDTAIPCGLIINELISNSFKHAFPEKLKKENKDKISEINVEFTSLEKEYKLLVGDNGIGLPADIEECKSKNLGLVLVEILVNQLKGTMNVVNKNGVRYEIIIEKENLKK